MMRPGPASVPAGLAPGGVVVHAYSGWTGLRLGVFHVVPGYDDARARADGDRVYAAAGDAPVVLVHYDGDTGERFVPRGHESGDVLDLARLGWT